VSMTDICDSAMLLRAEIIQQPCEFSPRPSMMPGDRYASNAVQNVSNYVARQGNSRLAFVPTGEHLGTALAVQHGEARAGINQLWYQQRIWA